MGVEARYAPGTALLIGSGSHWLLLGPPAGGPPDDALVDRLWRLLGEPGPVIERVLAALCDDYPDSLPSLVLLDATPGGELSAIRGEGRLTRTGDGWTLSLTEAPGEPQSWPRLTGGIVSARVAWVTPAGARVAAQPTDGPAPVPRTRLIDGVPAHILAATAPERHFDPGYTTYRPARLHQEQVERKQALLDRVEDEEDADLRQVTSETVLAVHCCGGHITMAYADSCRVCHEPVPPQEPQRVPRPALGVLRLPSGEAVPLDRGVVLGRKPGPVPGGEESPHLVHLPADSTYLSRMHLQIALDGWLVLAIDLGSQGGTRLRAAERDPIMLTPREPYVLEHGHTLDLADVYAVTFEVQQ